MCHNKDPDWWTMGVGLLLMLGVMFLALAWMCLVFADKSSGIPREAYQAEKAMMFMALGLLFIIAAGVWRKW
ncbi:MAG: hypothetical protein AB7G28_26480 [Pirellulales bacterium]